MKERLVLDFESSIEGRTDLCMIMESLHDFDFDWKITRKAEQIPETWEELKELCDKKDIANNVIYCSGLSFHENGILIDNGGYIISENRTPAQMWQIIQGLVSNE